MKFNNRHNEVIYHPVTGKQLWLSRSVAVVSMVILRVLGKDYVLVVHRHPKSTSPNKWCMPCGFLDWDESAGDAAIRETWEEAGLDLYKLRESSHPIFEGGIFNNEPWFVSTSPENGNQNVVFHFASVFEVDSLPKLSLDYTEPDELQDVQWVPLEQIPQMDMAFNHVSRIAQFQEKIYG